MIRVHHLNDSRSERVLWALEELGLPYEVERHERDAVTRLAPASLEAVHPLGKAPMIEDDGAMMVESGAILEYLSRRHGGGRLAVDPSSPEWPRYLELMHYAEGSAMLPLMMKLYLGLLGDAAAPLLPRVESEFVRHFGWLDSLLSGRDFFVGSDLTLADIQLAFVVRGARRLFGLEELPNLARFLARMEERPAYRRAFERVGGPEAEVW